MPANANWVVAELGGTPGLFPASRQLSATSQLPEKLWVVPLFQVYGFWA